VPGVSLVATTPTTLWFREESLKVWSTAGLHHARIKWSVSRAWENAITSPDPFQDGRHWFSMVLRFAIRGHSRCDAMRFATLCRAHCRCLTCEHVKLSRPHSRKRGWSPVSINHLVPYYYRRNQGLQVGSRRPATRVKKTVTTTTKLGSFVEAGRCR
jgi:hypothetical protein